MKHVKMSQDYALDGHLLPKGVVIPVDDAKAEFLVYTNRAVEVDGPVAEAPKPEKAPEPKPDKPVEKPVDEKK